MTQAFKFYSVISILLFLQLTDSTTQNYPDKSDTNSKDQSGGEEKATLFKNIDKVIESRPIQMVKKLSNIASEQFNSFSKEFHNTLNKDSKKQVNDENSIIPNAVGNNLILPAKAIAQTSFKTIGKPIEEMFSNIKKTYDDELAKSNQDEGYVPIIGAFTKNANKPVAIIKASKVVVENAIGGIFRSVSSIWNFGKKNTEKSVFFSCMVKTLAEESIKTTNEDIKIK
ncbi:uncharacterized protein LOC112599355 [Melanaphis sacchari]|uniref:uncharacterized protein LOC112599355 n=1 Tax=Melanaphis sacchari TaxID=742174 RepID=UPI000DC13908|nr:uncharacterized protein LOC112599355 [Melanaphis sacchari]